MKEWESKGDTTDISEDVRYKERTANPLTDMWCYCTEESHLCFQENSTWLASGYCKVGKKKKDEEWFLGLWLYKRVDV